MARDAALRGSLPRLWQVLRRFWPYARRQRGILAGSFVAVFAEALLRLLEPWPIKVVFDHIIVSKHHAHGWRIAHLNSLDTGSMLALCAGGLIVITALRAIAYHNDAKGGDLTLRIMADIGVLMDVVITAAMPLFASLLVMFGMAGFMLWLNWKLGLVALVAFPLFWISASRLTHLMTEVSRRQREREGAMAAVAAESIGAIKVVQALSLEQAFADSFFAENEQSFTNGMQASRLSAGLGRTLDLQIAVAVAVVMWYGARLTLAGELTPGSLVIFFTYLRNTFRPLQDFAKYSKRLAPILGIFRVQYPLRLSPAPFNSATLPSPTSQTGTFSRRSTSKSVPVSCRRAWRKTFERPTPAHRDCPRCDSQSADSHNGRTHHWP